jgi:hypothetical protein
MKRQYNAFYLIYGLLGLGAVIGVIFLYWAFQFPRQVLAVKNVPVPVITNPVAAGGVAVLTYDYCKYIDADGKLYTSLISHKTELLLPLADERTRKACADHLQVPMIVPPQALPDRYHFHFRATYRLNPLREVTVEWDSQEFEVK